MAATHEISNVCCVVKDNSNPAIFGYATTTSENTAQNLAHVFTTDSPVRDVTIFVQPKIKLSLNILIRHTCVSEE